MCSKFDLDYLKTVGEDTTFHQQTPDFLSADSSIHFFLFSLVVGIKKVPRPIKHYFPMFTYLHHGVCLYHSLTMDGHVNVDKSEKYITT